GALLAVAQRRVEDQYLVAGIGRLRHAEIFLREAGTRRPTVISGSDLLHYTPLSARPGTSRDRRGSGAGKEQVAKEGVQTKATCRRGNGHVRLSGRSTGHRGHRQS